ncbi:GntR family transcriptional regulator [Glutamicibacter uratoxydans]|uniref:GntR family transcriptional regulator n=1 Tax=Glutamicibacter uratoxydans TaxID=43667 RepID=A0A4Y4DX13_GLUUR|nr:GntR family transcriptional regulator [Glutamicibacter uratoxydans]GED06941.1 GntR family transcriptional regulator [Glutamicibacter uratoxydans]
MRASDKVYDTLRTEIVEWQLVPGTVLAEVEQSERLGVSRTPVREALARLVADGLAVAQRGRGVVVSEVGKDHLEDLFVLRRVLECENARLAADSAHAGEFAELAQAFDRAAAQESMPDAASGYYQLVARLDESIDQAAGNSYLSAALRNLRVHLQRVRRLAQDNPQRLRASAREHASIAWAIAQKNPDLAAAATTVHLHQSLTHIKNYTPTTERQHP